MANKYPYQDWLDEANSAAANGEGFFQGVTDWVTGETDRQFQQASAEAAMRFSSSEAEKQRQYETEMSNTAYQRSMADMQKAGLNPILTAAGGGQASTPSVSAQQGVKASGSNSSSAAASIITSALKALTSIL